MFDGTLVNFSCVTHIGSFYQKSNDLIGWLSFVTSFLSPRVRDIQSKDISYSIIGTLSNISEGNATKHSLVKFEKDWSSQICCLNKKLEGLYGDLGKVSYELLSNQWSLQPSLKFYALSYYKPELLPLSRRHKSKNRISLLLSARTTSNGWDSSGKQLQYLLLLLCPVNKETKNPQKTRVFFGIERKRFMLFGFAIFKFPNYVITSLD